MSRGQRFTFLAIAVVIAIVAAILITSGDDSTGGEDVNTAGSTATATATPTQGAQEASPQESETPTPTPTAPPTPLLKGGTISKLEFTEGDTVRFRVTSDADEEVHVHGYDIAKDIPAGKTVTVSFPATITGIFEIEYEHAGEQIGELRVDPK